MNRARDDRASSVELVNEEGGDRSARIVRKTGSGRAPRAQRARGADGNSSARRRRADSASRESRVFVAALQEQLTELVLYVFDNARDVRSTCDGENVHAERMLSVASAGSSGCSALGTFVANALFVMGRIEVANAIAAAAREAQQRGEHKEAADLYARALRVLTEGAPTAQVADLWEQIRSHPPLKSSEPPDRTAQGGRHIRGPK